MLERRIAVSSVMIISPKSPIRAVPVWSIRMLAYKDCQRRKEATQNTVAHPFDISMCDPEVVKVCYARCRLGKLCDMLSWATNENKPYGECAVGLTKRSRLASGLDLMYSIKSPLGIHSDMMRKRRGFSDTETPNRGKTFG